MTPEDKRLARELLEQGRLGVDQASEIIAETERTGRGFHEIARERGLLRQPPAPAGSRATHRQAPAPSALPPRTFAIILVSTSLLISLLAVASVLYLRSQWARDEEHIRDEARSITRAHQLHDETILKYQQGAAQRKETDLRVALARARQSMDTCENLALDGVPTRDLLFLLVAATNDYTAYLDRHPDDAPALVERARAWELRGNAAAELGDLELAAALRKSLEPSLRERIDRLRRRLGR